MGICIERSSSVPPLGLISRKKNVFDKETLWCVSHSRAVTRLWRSLSVRLSSHFFSNCCSRVSLNEKRTSICEECSATMKNVTADQAKNFFFFPFSPTVLKSLFCDETAENEFYFLLRGKLIWCDRIANFFPPVSPKHLSFHPAVV